MTARLLVLFDIDGTLLSATGASRGALVDALVAVYGTAGPIDSYDFSGKTDPQIVRELIEAAGQDPKKVAAGRQEALRLYREHLEVRLRPTDVRAKPGVAPLLTRLRADADVTLGLLTGNLEPCARVKLAPLDLNGFFPLGAFGSDHEERARLPAVAVQRAHRATGHRFERKNVVVIGDSVHDVRCGDSLGVRSVAVATGKTPAARLAEERPDALLDDLSDTERALSAILGRP